MSSIKRSIVGCQCVVQLGGLVPCCSLQGPPKVKACKSFLFTESSPKVENKEHLVDFVFNFLVLVSGLRVKQLMYRTYI